VIARDLDTESIARHSLPSLTRLDRATIAEAGVAMSTTKGRTPSRAFTLRVVSAEGGGQQV
jgi:hypothetical protein